MRILLPIIGLSLFLLYGCKRNKMLRETVYTGTTQVQYEQVIKDSLTGGLSTFQWDSSYTDQVRVTVDYEQERIRFDLSPQQHLCANLHDSYTFPIDGSLYQQVFNSVSQESFFLENELLHRNLFWEEGNGDSYTRRVLNFQGRR